ncbi:MAG: glycosyl transferase [Bryobacterales bacterium]|nr:glycosyl transferase [Bryobacterales bacterium]
MKPRLLFYCQHVLGMGHLVRSREIVRALGDFDVWFLNGGEPVDGFAFPAGVEVVQLPPIRSDAAFQAIDASEAVKAERRAMLLGLLGRVEPDVVVMEMFPFGRRKFAFELVPLLEEIRRRGNRTKVVSSVRDILVSKRDQARHEEQACGWLNEYFDLVLVHADERFQPLGDTFGRASAIRCPVAYTGFVTEPCRVIPSTRRGLGGTPRLIASAGGGRVGFPLLAATLEASRVLAPDTPHELTVLTGPYLPDDEFAQLNARAAGAAWIRVDRFAHDFVERLAAADLLVSQAGYNTCMNILSTQVKALVEPFAGNQNEEQSIRARKLEQLGLLGVLAPADLAPARLAARIAMALAQPAPALAAPLLALNGAAETARLLTGLSTKVPAYV